MDTDLDYTSLNALLNLWGDDGELQLDADLEARDAYLKTEVAPKEKQFDTLADKIDWLFTEGYYDRSQFHGLTDDQILSLFTYGYSLNHEFQSMIGAVKFYVGYAMRTNDQTQFLESFTDRAVVCAIVLSGGDLERTQGLIEDIITGRTQPATPTFLSTGKVHGGAMVSCFLIQGGDSMEAIDYVDAASRQLSKRGGGVGICLTNLRETGAPIQDQADRASGLVPVMKILEDDFSYANQLGQRQGAGAVYVNLCHPDIHRVLDTKRENADEKVRIKTLSLGVVIPDIAFDMARANEDLALFSPYGVEKVMGAPMTEFSVTEHYDEWVADDRITKYWTSARGLFQTIAELQFESGYPYLMFEDTVNQWNYIDGRISHSNLCVTGDTEILTSNGYRVVRDLYDSQEDFEVIVDERARTMNLKNVGTSVQKSTKMFRTAENADVFKVVTKEGYFIKATAWHKFYADRAGTVVKIPLTELEVGDKLLVQGAENAVWGALHAPDLAYLAGVLAADGTYAYGTNPSVRLDLYGDKDQFADKVQSAVWRVLDGREDLCERQATTRPEWTERAGDNPKLSMNSAPLAKVFTEWGVTPETKVGIPDFVKQGDKATQQAFLDGVWSLDGCVTGSVEHHIRSAELGSIDKEFLEDVQRMLLSFGVYSRIYISKKETSPAMLPDGHGGLKSYIQKKSWSLRANSKIDVRRLHELVEWRASSEEMYQNIMGNSDPSREWTQHKFRATVSEITRVSNEDVYDVTVENGHSLIFNGIVTGNCSEIAQVSTPSEFGTEEYGDIQKMGRDISCNLASMNVAAAMHGDDLAGAVSRAVRALTEVSDRTSLGIVPTVREGNRKSHSIGLGQMNLHGFLGSEKIMYGSDEALDFVNTYFAAIRFHSLWESSRIAEERGETFFEFEKSGYHAADGESSEALRHYTEGIWLTTPQTERIQEMFEQYGHHAPTVEDWKILDKQIQTHGLYNAYLSAVAPTGSISYINHATSSIHPIVSKIEIRKEGKIGRVYTAAPGMDSDNMDYFTDAYELGYKPLIDTYAVAQKHIDQSQSLTLFFKDKTTTRDLNKAYIYAWSRGRAKNEFGEIAVEDPRTAWKSGFIKTLYYTRIRQAAMEGTEALGCVSCAI